VSKFEFSLVESESASCQMAPNDFLRHRFLRYNLLEEEEEEGLEPFTEQWEQVPQRTLRITRNISIILDVLPPDYERYLIVQAEAWLAGNQLINYIEPQRSNLAVDQARLLIENFILDGLLLANEAIANRQFIEERLTELLLFYSDPDRGLQQRRHGLVT